MKVARTNNQNICSSVVPVNKDNRCVEFIYEIL